MIECKNFRHFIGEPCKICAGTLRYLSGNHNCVRCALEHSARRRNKDPMKNRSVAKAWRDANPDKVASYLSSNLKNLSAKRAAYRAANLEKERTVRNIRNRTYPDKACAYTAKRRFLKVAATPHWADFEIIAAFYEEAAMLTALSGVPWHVDHILALANGGGHHQFNLRVLPGAENLRKKAKLDLIAMARPWVPPGRILEDYRDIHGFEPLEEKA